MQHKHYSAWKHQLVIHQHISSVVYTADLRFPDVTNCQQRLTHWVWTAGTNVNKLCGKPHICPHPCMPHTAAELQPIHTLCLHHPAWLVPWIFMIDRQGLALGSSVEYGVIHMWLLEQPTKAAWWPWPFDLESGVWVMCDVGYLCANFSLPRPLCSRLRPDVCDRQTDVRQHHRLMPPPIRGRSLIKWSPF